jgi:hypothetical protein
VTCPLTSSGTCPSLGQAPEDTPCWAAVEQALGGTVRLLVRGGAVLAVSSTVWPLCQMIWVTARGTVCRYSVLISPRVVNPRLPTASSKSYSQISHGSHI